jgi:hypothetical protein
VAPDETPVDETQLYTRNDARMKSATDIVDIDVFAFTPKSRYRIERNPRMFEGS